MRILDLGELREVMDRHPELRMHQIPMDTGLLVEDRYMLVPTAEGELFAIDCEGLEAIASEPGQSNLHYMRGGNGGGNSGSDDAALDILSSYGIAPAT